MENDLWCYQIVHIVRDSQSNKICRVVYPPFPSYELALGQVANWLKTEEHHHALAGFWYADKYDFHADSDHPSIYNVNHTLSTMRLRHTTTPPPAEAEGWIKVWGLGSVMGWILINPERSARYEPPRRTFYPITVVPNNDNTGQLAQQARSTGFAAQPVAQAQQQGGSSTSQQFQFRASHQAGRRTHVSAANQTVQGSPLGDTDHTVQRSNQNDTAQATQPIPHAAADHVAQAIGESDNSEALNADNEEERYWSREDFEAFVQGYDQGLQ